MVIHQAFKFRLYPNIEQHNFLARQFGCARYVYNYFLRQRIDFYAAHKGEKKQGLNYFDTARALVKLKKQPETEWLNEVNSQALQQSLLNLDTAYKNFFAGRAEFPKFKRKHDKQSFRVPQFFDLDTDTGHLCLPKMTPIKIVVHRPIVGVMKSVTVSRTPSGHYFASILCEIETKERKPKRRGKEQGLDLGLKSLVVTSEGEKIAPPNCLRKSEKKLAQLQRELARKKPGSNHRDQARVKVARLHEHIANQRADFLHKQSRRLIDESKAIYVEGLNVAGLLANHSLAKSISDAGWGEFLRQLQYKGAWYGCRVEAIDRFFPSSRACGKCGCINAALTLADREWKCPECHTLHDRDINAARNILVAGKAQAKRAKQQKQECRAGMARTQTPGETGARKAGLRTRKPAASSGG
jgi:putative transposase